MLTSLFVQRIVRYKMPIGKKCGGCFKRIRSRFYVQSLETEWHERCLTCDVCQEILYSFGEKRLYYKGDMKLCKTDYMRLFVAGGMCSKCDKEIASTENVMKFENGLAYHQACFYCTYCKNGFKIGDSVRIPSPKVIICAAHNSVVIEKNLTTDTTSMILNNVIQEKQCNDLTK